MTPEAREENAKTAMAALRAMAEADAAEEERAEAELDAMSDDEQDTWLRSQGVDLDRVQARIVEARRRLASAAQVESLDAKQSAKQTTEQSARDRDETEGPSSGPDGEPPPVAVTREAPPAKGGLARRHELTWLLAAATATAVGGALAAAHYIHDEPPPPPDDKHEPTPPLPPAEDPLVLAAKLRAEATHACEEKRWADCLKALDAAKARDPAGDGQPEWRALRARADEGREGTKREKGR
jgi:hypothetical protein